MRYFGNAIGETSLQVVLVSWQMAKLITVPSREDYVKFLRLNSVGNTTVPTYEDGSLTLDSAIYFLRVALQNSVLVLVDLSRISKT